MGAHLGLGRSRPQRPSANPILGSALQRAGFTKSHETPVSVDSEAEVGGCVAWHGVVQHGTAQHGRGDGWRVASTSVSPTQPPS